MVLASEGCALGGLDGQDALVLSDAPVVGVEHIGAERQPVIVVDNAFADVAALRHWARDQRYQPIGEFYPGIRAPLPGAFTVALLATMGAMLVEVYGDDAAGLIGESFLSIVTTPPHRLTPIQRLPHYDGCGRDQFAAIAYLSQDDLGGTSFFRHRATGFETVSMDRFARYKAALEADIARHGLPPECYVSDGAPLFERLATVEAKPNRLVFYRGTQLHSGAIGDADRLSADPAIGRLTITAFFKKAQLA